LRHGKPRFPTTPAKIFAGVSYARLERWKSLVWPGEPDGTDTPLLHTKGFHTDDGKAVLHPVQWQPPAGEADADYDLLCDNGRMLEQFQSTNLLTDGQPDSLRADAAEARPRRARRTRSADPGAARERRAAARERSRGRRHRSRRFS